MKPKTIKIVYWMLTILLSLAFFFDGIGGITRQEAGQEVLRHLGYPMYALTIFGILKILGVIAILQNKYRTIKEWAFAGFSFNFVGAAASRAFAGDDFGLIIFPIIMLAVLLLLYFFWKKFNGLSPAVR